MMDDAYAFASLVPSTTAMDIVRSWNARRVQAEVAAELAAALALAVASRGDFEDGATILNLKVWREGLVHANHSSVASLIVDCGSDLARRRISDLLEVLTANRARFALERVLVALQEADVTRIPGFARVLARAIAMDAGIARHPTTLKFAFARISARDLAEEDGGGDDE